MEDISSSDVTVILKFFLPVVLEYKNCIYFQVTLGAWQVVVFCVKFKSNQSG